MGILTDAVGAVTGGKQTWSAGALPRQGGGEIPSAAVASGGGPGSVDARRKLRGDLLLHIVPQHGEDLLYKGIQLLLEQQSWVFGLHLTKGERMAFVAQGFQG